MKSQILSLNFLKLLVDWSISVETFCDFSGLFSVAVDFSAKGDWWWTLSADSSTVKSSPSANDMEARVASLEPVRAAGGYPFKILRHVTSNSVAVAIAVFSSVKVLCAFRVWILDMPFLVRTRMIRFLSGILGILLSNLKDNSKVSNQINYFWLNMRFVTCIRECLMMVNVRCM